MDTNPAKAVLDIVWIILVIEYKMFHSTHTVHIYYFQTKQAFIPYCLTTKVKHSYLKGPSNGQQQKE